MKFQLKLLVSAMAALPMAIQAADCPNNTIISASGNCTVPAGVIQVVVGAIGGGGGGADNVPFLGSAGGGGGGSSCGGLFTVTPGETLTYTIGAGGAGAAGLNNPISINFNGGPGGPTTVSSPSITGVTANGGSGGGAFPNVLQGGAGGTTAGCTGSGAGGYTGGNGGTGRFNITQSDGGGGGGGAAGSGAGGGNGGNGAQNAGGAGGLGDVSLFSGGNGGEGGDPNESGNVDAPSVLPGGGGGGAGEDTDASAPFTNGGNGAGGAVWFRYVLPHPITTGVNIPNCATVTCDPNPVPDGQSAACTATPAYGYSITSWTGCDTFLGNLCHVNNVTGPETVIANCEMVKPVPVLPFWGLGLLGGLLAGMVGFGRRLLRK